MKSLPILKTILFSIVLITSAPVFGQIRTGIYIAELEDVRHELKMTDDYMIHTIYVKNPARFIKTEGGFYEIDGSEIHVKLEFNSNYEADSVSSLNIPFAINGSQLTLGTSPRLVFNLLDSVAQELDSQWLFATRGPDEGQERRGEANTRKTLKFLKDGRFQWIAYDTDGMQFKGTGGGSYTSKDGVYTENIEYFSRDNARVGASLQFNYEIKGDDWHHRGNNSKGEPLYEIWEKRIGSK
jgi:hypothetical protein